MKNFLLSAALVLFAGPALAAELQCGPHGDVKKGLFNTYGETLQVTGLAVDGNFMEVYANLATTTWTLLVVSANGVACMAADGGNFELVGEPS